MNQLTIRHLQSGGMITNYYCSSKCGHCLYNCSPAWEKEYITPHRTQEVFRIIQSLGCSSIHIGGGEPFLKPDGLIDVAALATKEGIHIDYIETNSSWYQEESSCLDTLYRLKEHAIDMLLLSISPFHHAYIPFKKVKGVMKACKKAGIEVFPWIYDFYHELDSFDEHQPQDLEAYARKFGKNYFKELTTRYRLTMRGRTIATYQDLLPHFPTDSLPGMHQCCRELSNTTHFHIDLFGNYIPGLCTGFSIRLEDLGKPLNTEIYPLLMILYNEGVKTLLEIATREYGFLAQETYLSKCHLCFDIRRFLVIEKNMDTAELKPIGFYRYF